MKVLIVASQYWKEGPATGAPAKDAQRASAAADLLRQMGEKYASLQTLSTGGRVVSEISPTGGGAATSIKHTFSLNLARPEFYRVQWTNTVAPGATLTGAAWSAGDGHKVLTGGKVTTLLNREQTGPLAAGSSGGAAHTVPSLFFKDETGSLLKSLANPSLLAEENVDTDSCHVITADNGGRKVTLWLRKKDLFLKQIRTVHVPDAGKGNPQLTEDVSDETVRKLLKITGQEATPEMVSKVRQMRATAGKMADGIKVTITETYQTIAANELMIKEDFEVTVPAGATTSPTKKP